MRPRPTRAGAMNTIRRWRSSCWRRLVTGPTTSSPSHWFPQFAARPQRWRLVRPWRATGRKVGIDVELQNIPYATIRPELITRTFQGATCHTVSQRLTPAIGASNYVSKSTYSYGTEHP